MFSTDQVQTVIAQIAVSLLVWMGFLGLFFGVFQALARRATDNVMDWAAATIRQQRAARRSRRRSKGASSAPL